MFAAVPTWVVDGGTIVGSLTAFFALVGLVLKSPPGRWLKEAIAEDIVDFVGAIAEKVALRALTLHAEEHVQEAIDDRLPDAVDTSVEEVLEDVLPRHLEPILYELRANGGGSFRDHMVARLDSIEADVAIIKEAS